ncbi:MAG: dipeptidyl aminopeptidase [Phycisphaerae bacterium]|jgi:dienelactone hydrolase
MKKITAALVIAVSLVGLESTLMAETAQTQASLPVHWDTEQLFKAPATYPAEGLSEEGVTGIFFEGLPLAGKPTRVFAWYGLPEGASAEKKVPGMVLVHGGGGTAFAHWVRMWNQRGYAAIAIDWGGCIPRKPADPASAPIRSNSTPGLQATTSASAPATQPAKVTGPPWTSHEWAGPKGPTFAEVLDTPVEDQWNYHAVAAVILSHSLLRSMPEVDADRTALTGISWGGYLTCLTSAVDNRFKFAIPVYGSGFLGEESIWMPTFKEIGPEKTARWLTLWDPSQYLPSVSLPMLWLGGPTDQCYPFNTFSRSYRLPSGPRVVSTPTALKHSHEDGWAPPEICAYADSMFKCGQALAKVVSQNREDKNGQTFVTVTFEMPPGPARIIWSELAFTTDSCPWMKRAWFLAAPELKIRDHTVRCVLPEKATAYYFNLIDSRGLCVSSELVDLANPR